MNANVRDTFWYLGSITSYCYENYDVLLVLNICMYASCQNMNKSYSWEKRIEVTIETLLLLLFTIIILTITLLILVVVVWSFILVILTTLHLTYGQDSAILLFVELHHLSHPHGNIFVNNVDLCHNLSLKLFSSILFTTGCSVS